MSVDAAKSCYVSMPLGVKAGIDFDAIYAGVILPVAHELDLAMQRMDSLETHGSIRKAIFDALVGADFVIADVSLANPNVLYELGIRHALRSSGTIIISSDVGMWSCGIRRPMPTARSALSRSWRLELLAWY
jgi:hypothetical protein